MMSFENLEKTQAKRAAKKKKKTTACKRKRDLKRKIYTLKPKIEAQTISSKKIADSLISKNKIARISEIKTIKISKTLFKVSITRIY